MLTAQDLHDAFMELGLRAQHEGKVVELAIYGGSALMLALNFRVSTQDVDAVVEGDQETVTRLAEDIDRVRNWPNEWLNDGVRTYLSPQVNGLHERHSLFRAYPSEQRPGLRVFVPSPEYLLAMKLMSMRIDPAGNKSDVADILNFLDIVGFTIEKEVIDFAASFYPEAKLSPRLRLSIRTLWRIKDNPTQEGRHATPAYLGRSRSAP
jgi:hypothetical protein